MTRAFHSTVKLYLLYLMNYIFINQHQRIQLELNGNRYFAPHIGAQKFPIAPFVGGSIISSSSSSLLAQVSTHVNVRFRIKYMWLECNFIFRLHWISLFDKCFDVSLKWRHLWLLLGELNNEKRQILDFLGYSLSVNHYQYTEHIYKPKEGMKYMPSSYEVTSGTHISFNKYLRLDAIIIKLDQITMQIFRYIFAAR